MVRNEPPDSPLARDRGRVQNMAQRGHPTTDPRGAGDGILPAVRGTLAEGGGSGGCR